MNLSTYLTAGAFLAVAIIYGAWSWQSKGQKATIAAQQATIASLNEAVIEAKGVNDANIQTLAAIKEDLARQAKVAAKYEALANKRGAALKATLKRIEDAPLTDDGPIAPVLGRELDELRNDGNGKPPADGDHKDPVGALPDLIAPSLPGTPAAPTS